jgi:hypothetical protein
MRFEALILVPDTLVNSSFIFIRNCLVFLHFDWTLDRLGLLGPLTSRLRNFELGWCHRALQVGSVFLGVASCRTSCWLGLNSLSKKPKVIN